MRAELAADASARGSLTRHEARQVRTDVGPGATTHALLAKIAPHDINVDGEDEAGAASARARDWLGKVPGGSVTYSAETAAALQAAGFVALPVKAGDLVCFPGTTDHLSLRNETPKSENPPARRAARPVGCLPCALLACVSRRGGVSAACCRAPPVVA